MSNEKRIPGGSESSRGKMIRFFAPSGRLLPDTWAFPASAFMDQLHESIQLVNINDRFAGFLVYEWDEKQKNWQSFSVDGQTQLTYDTGRRLDGVHEVCKTDIDFATINSRLEPVFTESECSATPSGSNRQRLFVDMDGTLTVFTPVDHIEQLYEPGFFANAKPMDRVIEAIRDIVRSDPNIEVDVLSAYLTASKYALTEKNAWLDRFLPEIDRVHRIFVPCGMDKKQFVPGGLRETDTLLDDYSENLRLWEPPARGVKLMNGINGTHGTWQSRRVVCDAEPKELAASIVSAMDTGESENDLDMDEDAMLMNLE